MFWGGEGAGLAGSGATAGSAAGLTESSARALDMDREATPRPRSQSRAARRVLAASLLGEAALSALRLQGGERVVRSELACSSSRHGARSHRASIERTIIYRLS